MYFTKRIFHLLALLALVCGPAAQAAAPVCGKMSGGSHEMHASAAAHGPSAENGASDTHNAAVSPHETARNSVVPCPHHSSSSATPKSHADTGKTQHGDHPAKADTCQCAMSGCHAVKSLSSPFLPPHVFADVAQHGETMPHAILAARPEILIPPPRI